MIRVEAASRLHFGLLALPGTEPGLTRQFGGAGLMIEQPGLTLNVTPAKTWSAEGSHAERALAFGQRYAEAIQCQECFHLHVGRAPAEHLGLGTGTQLGLAVVQAIASATGRSAVSATELAQHVGRGQRSGIGIHGFAHGGFLVDGGKGPQTRVAPLLARMAFPEDWPILLIVPHDAVGTHGTRETTAFARLAAGRADGQQTEALCRLVLLGLLPALTERDFVTFSAALGDFNRRVGEMFRPCQGGVYADATIATAVRQLQGRGIEGVGQSSWGPTVFAVLPDREQAQLCRDWLVGSQGYRPDEVIVTRACNRPALVEALDPPARRP